MWDLIVTVPDHCLSFYFKRDIGPCHRIRTGRFGPGLFRSGSFGLILGADWFGLIW